MKKCPVKTSILIALLLAGLSGCADSETRIDQIKTEALASMQSKIDEVEAEKTRVASEVRRTSRDALTEMQALEAEFNVRAAGIKAAAEDKAEGAQIAMAAFAAKRAEDGRQIQNTANVKIAKIESQQLGLEQLGAFAKNPLVAGAINSLPGGGLIQGAIAGLLGYGLRSRAAKKADSTWDEASNRMLALMTPPPAAPKPITNPGA